MKRDYKLYLNDLKDSITLIEGYLKNASEEGFNRDTQLQGSNKKT